MFKVSFARFYVQKPLNPNYLPIPIIFYFIILFMSCSTSFFNPLYKLIPDYLSEEGWKRSLYKETRMRAWLQANDKINLEINVYIFHKLDITETLWNSKVNATCYRSPFHISMEGLLVIHNLLYDCHIINLDSVKLGRSHQQI